jgi:CubicO group peptidase (beta-lactamase class C family)
MDRVTPEEVGMSSARLDRIRPVMQSYVDENVIAGVITLVARHGKVAHLECIGMMDIEADKPMQRDTIFRIYSMTKPITCVAMMMLLEEGRFQLYDPVAKYIPEFADLKVLVEKTEKGIAVTDLEREITMRDLFTHTAGLGYGLFEDSPVEDLYRASPLSSWQLSLPDMVQEIAKLPLAHQPGTVWRYSIAHDVLGYLIGVVTGTPFDSFLQDRVFKPLGMADTGFYVPQEKADRFAAMYTTGDTGELTLLEAPATSPRLNSAITPSGGGGLVSTTFDYLRFAQMLLDGGELNGSRLLGRKTVELMTTNHLPSGLLPIHAGTDPIRGYGYGLGVGVKVDVAQTGMLGTNGSYGWRGTAGTFFWVDPKEALIGLIMPQFVGLEEPVSDGFVNLAYQAIID